MTRLFRESIMRKSEEVKNLLGRLRTARESSKANGGMTPREVLVSVQAQYKVLSSSKMSEIFICTPNRSQTGGARVGE